MNKKLLELIDNMMKEFGYDFPEELRKEYRKKRIIVVDDETGEEDEILREGKEESEEDIGSE